MTDVLRPVDETTAALVVACLQRARTRCESPVQALGRAGLLMTEHQAALIRRDILASTAGIIRNTRMKDLQAEGLMPRDATPAQVAKALADRIEWLAEQAGKGEFR